MTALTETLPLAGGLTIPVVGFGTWMLEEGETCYRACREALDAGYRHIDTARAYGNEASVGKALRDSGLDRDEVFITSKLPAEAKTAQQARHELEITMTELGLDHMDLYLVHAPWPWDEKGADYEDGNREIWAVMEEAQREGRTRAIGVSNFERSHLDNVLSVAEIAPAVNQIRWFPGLHPDDTIAACRERDIVVEAYSPIAHGDLLEHSELAEIAERLGVSTPQVCLRYLLQKGAVVLPKATSRDHIRQNAELDFTLGDDDLALIDALQHRDD